MLASFVENCEMLVRFGRIVSSHFIEVMQDTKYFGIVFVFFSAFVFTFVSDRSTFLNGHISKCVSVYKSKVSKSVVLIFFFRILFDCQIPSYNHGEADPCYKLNILRQLPLILNLSLINFFVQYIFLYCSIALQRSTSTKKRLRRSMYSPWATSSTIS
uniref:Uncharacterized protein n=1 Tax=Ditylum brightwellii TaxID=49249 RepID=A0A7S4R1L9_9STRA